MRKRIREKKRKIDKAMKETEDTIHLLQLTRRHINLKNKNKVSGTILSVCAKMGTLVWLPGEEEINSIQLKVNQSESESERENAQKQMN